MLVVHSHISNRALKRTRNIFRMFSSVLVQGFWNLDHTHGTYDVLKTFDFNQSAGRHVIGTGSKLSARVPFCSWQKFQKPAQGHWKALVLCIA